MRIAELSNEACSVSYDWDIPCVVIEWHGYANTSQFRQINENVLRLLIERNCYKVLADMTHLPMIGDEDQKWVNQDWLPRALQAGYEVCGIVNSHFYFSRVATKDVMRQINKNELQVEYFDTQSAARDWLRSV